MHIAAIYDIHGNLPALEAVLTDIRRSGVDFVVVGGDVVPGPMPVDSLECLLHLDIPTRFIQGNGESNVLAHIAGSEITHVPETARQAIAWVSRQLNADHQREIARWPATFGLEIDGVGQVLFCHATPRNNTEIFTRETPSHRLTPVFGAVDASVVVCGHTHMQFDRRIDAIRVVNAGSVGMPFGASGAHWLLIDPGVHLRRTSYDLEAAADRIRATSYPQADEFASRNVLAPPSEGEILQIYARAELK